MGRSLPRRIVTHIGATVETVELSAAARLGDAGLATAAVGAAAVAAGALSLPVPGCPLLAIAGMPCPGCGMTRLADGLAHGHVLDALGTDPLGVLVVAAIAALAVVGLARRVGVPTSLPPGSIRTVPALLAGALMVRWAGVLVGFGPTLT